MANRAVHQSPAAAEPFAPLDLARQRPRHLSNKRGQQPCRARGNCDSVGEPGARVRGVGQHLLTCPALRGNI